MLGSDVAGSIQKSRQKGVTQADARSEKVENWQEAVPRDPSAPGQGLCRTRLWDCCWELPALQRFHSSPQQNRGKVASAPKAAVLNKSQVFSCVSQGFHSPPAQAITDPLHQAATQVPGTWTFQKAKVSVPFP